MHSFGKRDDSCSKDDSLLIADGEIVVPEKKDVCNIINNTNLVALGLSSSYFSSSRMLLKRRYSNSNIYATTNNTNSHNHNKNSNNNPNNHQNLASTALLPLFPSRQSLCPPPCSVNSSRVHSNMTSSSSSSSSSSCSTSDCCETVHFQIESPADLPGGYELLVNDSECSASFPSRRSSRSSIMVTVPDSGVKKGEIFQAKRRNVTSNQHPQNDNKPRSWNAGIFQCLQLGLFHKDIWKACCCPHLLIQQMNKEIKAAGNDETTTQLEQQRILHQQQKTQQRSTLLLVLFFAFDILVLPVCGYLVASSESPLAKSEWFQLTVVPWLESMYIWASVLLTIYTLRSLIQLRTSVRTQYNIRGNCFADTCCMVWCTHCALVQMARQTLPHHNHHHHHDKENNTLLLGVMKGDDDEEDCECNCSDSTATHETCSITDHEEDETSSHRDDDESSSTTSSSSSSSDHDVILVQTTATATITTRRTVEFLHHRDAAAIMIV